MDKSFFTYKGFPLVRHEDVIYYGLSLIHI